jgi:tRNA splicing endonuclease
MERQVNEIPVEENGIAYNTEDKENINIKNEESNMQDLKQPVDDINQIETNEQQEIEEDVHIKLEKEIYNEDMKDEFQQIEQQEIEEAINIKLEKEIYNEDMKDEFQQIEQQEVNKTEPIKLQQDITNDDLINDTNIIEKLDKETISKVNINDIYNKYDNLTEEDLHNKVKQKKYIFIT